MRIGRVGYVRERLPSIICWSRGRARAAVAAALHGMGEILTRAPATKIHDPISLPIARNAHLSILRQGRPEAQNSRNCEAPQKWTTTFLVSDERPPRAVLAELMATGLASVRGALNSNPPGQGSIPLWACLACLICCNQSIQLLRGVSRPRMASQCGSQGCAHFLALDGSPVLSIFPF